MSDDLPMQDTEAPETPPADDLQSLRSMETLAPDARPDEPPGGSAGESADGPPDEAVASPENARAPAVSPAVSDGASGFTSPEPLGLAETLPEQDESARAAGDPSAPRPNVQIGQYQLIRELGRGGMGAVFLARDTRLGRLVAVKFLHVDNPHRVARFLSEARTTAQCSHDNIVVLYEAGQHQGRPYLVLEYLQGQTLEALLLEHRATAELDSDTLLPPARAIQLILPVLRALQRAHGMGIVHRDLKPSNVMLTDAGKVKVLDFGIAKSLSPAAVADAAFARDDAGQQHAWVTDGLVGTPYYASPEQLAGQPVDARTDIWSIGIMLYEMVIGRHPLAPLSMAKLHRLIHLDEPMPRVASARPDLSGLGPIIDRCLLKHPDDRIASAAELIADLEPLLADQKSAAHTDGASPYTGLTAFQEGDAGRFFGRDADIADLVARVRKHPIVTVAGASGIGKSSVVRAGVIPALKRSGEGWDAVIVRPGRKPLAGLLDALHRAQLYSSVGDGGSARTSSSADGPARTRNASRALTSAGEDYFDLAEAQRRLTDEPGYLGAVLRARAARKLRKLVLFIDQFEEIYTAQPSPEERATFLACLASAADDPTSPLRVVLSIRSDFLERMAEDRAFMAAATRGLVFLAPLSRDGLRAALERPLAAVNYRFESGDMVDRMLDELQTTPGALPLLQFTASQLWAVRDRRRQLLTEDSYESMDGVAGALARHADHVLAGMSAQQTAVARSIFQRLVTPERTRAMISMGELRELPRPVADIDATVAVLADARLLAVDSDGADQQQTVEIVHESLIARWPTLSRWLDDRQEDAEFLDRLQQAARQWEKSDHAPGLLWRDRAALEAVHWLERQQLERGQDRGLNLGWRDERYLTAVVEFAERGKRRRRRILTIGLAGLAATAVVVTLLALRAQSASDDAGDQAARARSIARAALASELATREPTTALALIRELSPQHAPDRWSEIAQLAIQRGVAYQVLPGGLHGVQLSPDGLHLLAIDNKERAVAIHRLDGTRPPVALIGHDAPVTGAVFSPGGTRVASYGADATVRVWNVSGAGEPAVYSGHRGDITDVAFSPDGALLVTGSTDTTARVWKTAGKRDEERNELVILDHSGAVTSVGFNADGTHVITEADDRAVRVWTLDPDRAAPDLDLNAPVASTPVRTLGGPDECVIASRDGEHLLNWLNKGSQARLWTSAAASASARPRILPEAMNSSVDAVFNAYGSVIATSSLASGSVSLWRTDRAEPPVILDVPDGRVVALALDASGAQVATVSGTAAVSVWSTSETEPPRALPAPYPVDGVYLSPDGQYVAATSSTDSGLLLWPADGTRPAVELLGHRQTPVVEFTYDSRYLITYAANEPIRVWRLYGHLAGHLEELGQQATLGIRERTTALSPDDQLLALVRSDDTIAIRAIADGTTSVPGVAGVLRDPDPMRGPPFGLEFSPDGAQLVAWYRDKSALVWDVDGASPPIVLSGHGDVASAPAFSSDSTRIAIFDRNAIAVHDLAPGGAADPPTLRLATSSLPVLSYSNPDDVLRSVEFSPDGSNLLGRYDDGIVLARLDVPDAPMELDNPDGSLLASRFSPNGTRVLTLSESGRLRLWNTASPEDKPLVLLGNRAEFSADGSTLAHWSDGALEIRVWTHDDGRRHRHFTGHEQRIRAVAFSFDSTRMASASDDGTVRIWTLDGLLAPIVLRVPTARFTAVAFSPDGQHLASAATDGVLRVWRTNGSTDDVGPPALLSDGYRYGSVRFSRAGDSVVAERLTRVGLSLRRSLAMWTGASPIARLDDPRLWSATRHCLSVDQRVALLGVTTGEARRNARRCLRRVEDAGRGGAGELRP